MFMNSEFSQQLAEKMSKTKSTEVGVRAIDKKGNRDNFPCFSVKTYFVTPH